MAHAPPAIASSGPIWFGLQYGANSRQGGDDQRGVDSMSSSRRLQWPPGMTEGGAAHYRERHPADRAARPRMDAGARRHDIESTERSKDKSRWHERVGHVQDQHQAVLKCPVAAPARQPNNVHAAAQKQQRAGRCIKRPGDPQRKHDGA